jgi:hypothetical protein
MRSHFQYDMPQNYYFNGGSAETTLTPLGLAALLGAVVLIFLLPRRKVITPLLVAGLLLPLTINVVIGGIHFPAFRILVLAGWLRVAIRRDLHLPKLNAIDKAFLLWALCNATAFCLLWGSLSAVTNRIGFLWSNVGAYFLVRTMVRDKFDVLRAIKTLAVVAAVIAPMMLLEHITRHDLFTIVGAAELSDIRYGAVRARGPFSHAIIAGTVGAMLLPLFIGLRQQGRRYRMLATMGIVAGITMAVASASSTPLMTCAAGLLVIFLWGARRRMRWFRWGLVIGIASLQLAMKAPVWFLIARTGGVLGGSGEHRAMLIDNFIHHFGEWWMIGTRYNADWGYDMWDVDNAFVAAGIGGGIITFLAFIAIFVCAYKRIGRSRKLTSGIAGSEHLVWSLGACLFANTVGFFGIVYFDQSVLAWYLLLAMISATAAFVTARNEMKSQSRIPAAELETMVADTAALVHSRRTLQSAIYGP